MQRTNDFIEQDEIDTLFEPPQQNERKRKLPQPDAHTDVVDQQQPAYLSSEFLPPAPKRTKLIIRTTYSSSEYSAETYSAQMTLTAPTTGLALPPIHTVDDLFSPIANRQSTSHQTHSFQITDNQIDDLFVPASNNINVSTNGSDISSPTNKLRDDYIVTLQKIGLPKKLALEISEIYSPLLLSDELAAYCQQLLSYFSLSDLSLFLVRLRLKKPDIILLLEKLPIISQHHFAASHMTLGETIAEKHRALLSFLQYIGDILNFGLAHHDVVTLLYIDHRKVDQILTLVHALLAKAATHEGMLHVALSGLRTQTGRDLIRNKLKNIKVSAKHIPAKSVAPTTTTQPVIKKKSPKNEISKTLREQLKFSDKQIETLAKTNNMLVAANLHDDISELLNLGFTHDQLISTLTKSNGRAYITRLIEFAQKLIEFKFSPTQLIKILHFSTVDIYETIINLYPHLLPLGFDSHDICEISNNRDAASTLRAIVEHHPNLTRHGVSKEQIIKAAKFKNQPSHLIQLLAGISPAELDLLSSARQKTWYRASTDECILICKKNSVSNPCVYFSTLINRFAEVLTKSKQLRAKVKLMQNTVHLPNALWHLLWPNTPLPAQSIGPSDLHTAFSQTERFFRGTDAEQPTVWVKCDSVNQAQINLNILLYLIKRMDKDAKESGEAAELFSIELYDEYLMIGDYDIFLNCLEYEEPYKTYRTSLPQNSSGFPIVSDALERKKESACSQKKSRGNKKKNQDDTLPDEPIIIDDDIETVAEITTDAGMSHSELSQNSAAPLAESSNSATPVTPFLASNHPYSPGLFSPSAGMAAASFLEPQEGISDDQPISPNRSFSFS